MKKVALILLICSYTVATMGFSLQEFYCCGKLKSVTVEITPNKKQTCNKGDGSGCCDNKYQFYKVKDNHLSGKALDLPLKDFTDLDLFTSEIQSISFFTQEIDVIKGNHAPPIYTSVPIYIFNCVFRI
ncbi:MAG: hypothetical protein ABIN89_17235 [Chitinophagaceae bacterium]